jgi:hypothetical protein
MFATDNLLNAVEIRVLAALELCTQPVASHHPQLPV